MNRKHRLCLVNHIYILNSPRDRVPPDKPSVFLLLISYMATNNSGKQLSTGRKDEKVKHSSSGYLHSVPLWEDLGKLKKRQREGGDQTQLPSCERTEGNPDSEPL